MIARLLWLLFLLAPATFAERISYTVERPLVVGVLLFDGFEMLDVFGPLEMFSSLDARVRIVTIAAKAGPVHPRNGPAVMAEQSLAEAGALDLFLIPGGFGTRGAVNDAVLIAGIKRLSQQAPQVATVCTGAALLARTGLLDGRRATTVDWIMLATLLGSVLLGAWRGLVFEVISVAGWIVAFILAQLYAPQAAASLPMAGATEPMRYAAGFVLIFVLVLFAVGFAAWLIKRIVEAVGVRPIDRVLGAAFGVFRGVLLLLAVAVVVGMTPLQASAAWKESAGAPILLSMLQSLKPLLPAQFGKHLK